MAFQRHPVTAALLFHLMEDASREEAVELEAAMKQSSQEDEKRAEILQNVKKATNFVKQCSEEETLDLKVLGAVKAILVAYVSLEDKSMETRMQLRLEASHLLLENDTVQHLSVILKKIIDTWLTRRFRRFRLVPCSEKLKKGFLIIAVAVSIIFYGYADVSSEFAHQVCKNENVMAVILKMLEELRDDHLKGKLQEDINRLLFYNLAATYNLSMHADSGNVELLREQGVIGRIKPYLSSRDKDFRIFSLMCLIYIEDDSESVNLSKNTEAVKYLIDRLKFAVTNKDRRAEGFSSLEILKGLTKFAVADENKSRLADLGILPILKEVLQTGEEDEKINALQALGQLAFNENNADIIRKEMIDLLKDISHDNTNRELQKNADTILWIIEKPQAQDESHSADQPVVEDDSSIDVEPSGSAKDLAKFAVVDENKSRQADLGVLPILKEVLQTGEEDEKIDALQTLGQLAFNKKNAGIIRKEMMDLLKDISRDDANEELQRNAKTVLWIIEKPQALDRSRFSTIQRAVEGESSLDVEPSGSAKGEQKKGHIMISYSWKNQTVVLQIRDFLAAENFKVWIDREDLGGNLYEEISAAIESASIVLISISEAYKDSPICRREASYASEKRKTVIPMKVDHYNPDGWLGLLISGAIYHDFSGGFSEEAAKSLLREIKRTCVPMKAWDSVDEASILGRNDSTIRRGATLRKLNASFADKSANEVKRWLRANNIGWFQEISLDARQIVFLAEMREEAPESFYQFIKEELKVTSLEKMTDFVDALNTLPFS